MSGPLATMTRATTPSTKPAYKNPNTKTNARHISVPNFGFQLPPIQASPKIKIPPPVKTSTSPTPSPSSPCTTSPRTTPPPTPPYALPSKLKLSPITEFKTACLQTEEPQESIPHRQLKPATAAASKADMAAHATRTRMAQMGVQRHEHEVPYTIVEVLGCGEWASYGGYSDEMFWDCENVKAGDVVSVDVVVEA